MEHILIDLYLFSVAFPFRHTTPTPVLAHG